jgi:hypothetical protein
MQVFVQNAGICSLSTVRRLTNFRIFCLFLRENKIKSFTLRFKVLFNC